MVRSFLYIIFCTHSRLGGSDIIENKMDVLLVAVIYCLSASKLGWSKKLDGSGTARKSPIGMG